MWLDGLPLGTTYFYQAYATNEAGTGLGEILSFTTHKDIKFKKITVTDITAVSMVASGGIADTGGMTIEEEGFLLSGYGYSSSSVSGQEGSVVFKNLYPNKTYTVQYYAKTPEGEFKSPISSATTLSGLASISIPKSIYHEDKVSATLSASIVALDGAPVKEVGFCYSLYENISMREDNVIYAELAEDGSFTAFIDGLFPQTLYFYKAFARTEFGIAFSDTRSFPATTVGYFYDLTITDITSTSVTFIPPYIYVPGGHGEMNIWYQGICWSSDKQLPTVEDNKIETDNLFLYVTASNLEPETKYYARQYAIGWYDDDLVYSRTYEFTTLPAEAVDD